MKNEIQEHHIPVCDYMGMDIEGEDNNMFFLVGGILLIAIALTGVCLSLLGIRSKTPYNFLFIAIILLLITGSIWGFLWILWVVGYIC